MNIHVQADPYFSSSVKKVVGKTIQVQGRVVLHQNQNILMQYAVKNTPITNNVFIKTRSDSKIKIKFLKGETLTLGQNSKVYLSFANRYGKISVKLLKGKLLIQDYGLGKKNIIASAKNSKHAYSGEYLAMSFKNKKEKIYTTKGNKVYKYNLSGKAKSSFQEADLDDLLKKNSRNKKQLYATRNLDSPKSKSNKKSPLDNEKNEESPDIEDEINSMFDTDQKKTEEKQETASNDIENEIDSFFEESETTTKATNDQIFVDDDTEKFKLDLDFLIRAVAYTQEPKAEHDIDDTPFAFETRVGIGNKTIIGSKSSVTSAGWIEVGTRKKTYTSIKENYDSRKKKRGYITLNELYYQMNLEKSDLTIGKKVYRTGKGMVFSPSDRLTPRDTVIPTDPLYLGNFLVNYDFYVGDFDFSLVFLPVFKPSRTPRPFNRWTVLPQGANFNLTSEYPSGLNRDNIQSFFKTETTIDGWDLALAIYNGPNTDPVIRNDIDNKTGEPEFVLVQEYVPVTNISFGFSTTFQRLEIHGEILKQNASEGRDDSYTIYMIGGFYTIDEWCKIIGIDRITTILELTNEKTHKTQTYPYYVASSSTSRLFQKSIISSTTFQLTEKTSLSYDFHIDNKKKGQASVYSYSYSFQNSGRIKVKYEQFSGTGESLYATWDNNDNLTVEYRYNF